MADSEYRRLACGHCAALFTPTQAKGLYCGKRCKVAGWRQRNPAAVAKHRATEAHKPPAPRKVSPVYFNACTQCGKGWTGRQVSTLCSDSCARAKQSAAADARARADHAAAGRVLRCHGCGAEFCPIYGRKHGGRPLCMVCSDESRRAERRAKSHHSRAKRYGVHRKHFNPVRVLERDGWTCQLCGIPTPRALRGTTAPNAPELDHITPLFKGGPHTMSNCQCACRACNGAKGADATWRPALAA